MSDDADIQELRDVVTILRQRAQQLEDEVERLRHDNDELRDRNERLVVALTHN